MGNLHRCEALVKIEIETWNFGDIFFLFISNHMSSCPCKNSKMPKIRTTLIYIIWMPGCHLVAGYPYILIPHMNHSCLFLESGFFKTRDCQILEWGNRYYYYFENIHFLNFLLLAGIKPMILCLQNRSLYPLGHRLPKYLYKISIYV